jgi:hypothetical protein
MSPAQSGEWFFQLLQGNPTPLIAGVIVLAVVTFVIYTLRGK